VDVFFEDEAEVFERAREVEYSGKPVFFVSLEDLIRQKLNMGPRLKDTSDIIALLKTNEDKIDWSYFDRKLDDEEREKLNKLWRVARGELEVTAVFGRANKS
jgi:single-stranded DNA-specific DHH superfamily exonuclease